jgi:hypothetical protein
MRVVHVLFSYLYTEKEFGETAFNITKYIASLNRTEDCGNATKSDGLPGIVAFVVHALFSKVETDNSRRANVPS